MATTPMPLKAADDLAFKLLNEFDLVGVESCEEGEDGFTYHFESGHWAEVRMGAHGITYQLHQPDEV